MAWASSQHGDWVPRTSIPRDEPGGSYIAIRSLALEDTQCYFCIILLVEEVTGVH